MIIRTELNPVIITPALFKERMLRVTTAMDSPKERAILSMIFICLKKTSVQAKPGRKKTSTNPRSALMKDKRSRNGRANSENSLIGVNQSMSYISSPSVFRLGDI